MSPPPRAGADGPSAIDGGAWRGSNPPIGALQRAVPALPEQDEFQDEAMTNPARLPTLSDLVSVPQRLVLSCYRCARKPIYLTPEDAVARYGAETTFDDLRRRLRCDECGALGRDRQIDVRPCIEDFYAAQAREKHERNVILYGEAGAELMRQHGRSRHSFTTTEG